MAAIRTKVVDVELWGRDNYVSKGTFNMVVGEIKSLTLRLEEEMKLSNQRFQDKIDERFTR